MELIKPSELCAVVKADGYGHGDVPVAVEAVEAGATRLAVALVEEGVRLREAGLDLPIITLSEPDPTSLSDLIEFQITPSVYTTETVSLLDAAGSKMNVHINVDTGMHRVGVATTAARSLREAILSSSNLTLEGVYTHFAIADEDDGFTDRQIAVFDEVIHGWDVPLVHLANSAGAILFEEARRDMCRVGLSLYGLHPCDETRGLIDLRPAMRVVSHVSHVQRLSEGARPSYGRVRPLKRDATVATIPIGYADGYTRALSTSGQVLVGGQRYPMAGRVTMDQIVIDVGDDDVAVGDEVVLMGRQGEQEITADELAETLGTITHEIVCGFGPRVPRRYNT